MHVDSMVKLNKFDKLTDVNLILKLATVLHCPVALPSGCAKIEVFIQLSKNPEQNKKNVSFGTQFDNDRIPVEAKTLTFWANKI